MFETRRSAGYATLAVTALYVISAWTTGDLADFSWLDLSLVALNTLPLLFIHRNPVAVALVFGVTYPSWLFAGNEGHLLQSLPSMVALYASGEWSAQLWVRAIALITPAWMVAAAFTGLWDAEPLEIGYVGIVFVVAWTAGVLYAARRRHVTELETKTHQLEMARQELARRAVADERARIARELHDVVAHAMSLITVQAGVGAHLVETDPGQAGESLSVIERTGRQALSEMRRMLAVLSNPDDGAEPPAPQPGLDELPELIQRAREAGVPLSYRLEGEVPLLPAGLELAIYRVVQEALTNVIKHAPNAATSIELHSSEERIEVIIHSHRAVDEVVYGQGLKGMRERVALYDGTLDLRAGREGFRIEASFPRESEQ